MPRALVASGSDGTPHLYFCVDRPAGRGAPNDRFDVLLVQFLLRIATSGNIYWPSSASASAPAIVGATRVGMTRPADPLPPNLPAAPPGAEIVIDGYCGDQTIRFIESFQQEMVRRGERVSVDGQVKPWAGATSYTLLLLNQALSRSSWGGPRKWVLFNSPGFPQELFSCFFSGLIPFP